MFFEVYRTGCEDSDVPTDVVHIDYENLTPDQQEFLRHSIQFPEMFMIDRRSLTGVEKKMEEILRLGEATSPEFPYMTMGRVWVCYY